jgi:hypothetical protein
VQLPLKGPSGTIGSFALKSPRERNCIELGLHFAPRNVFVGTSTLGASVSSAFLFRARAHRVYSPAGRINMFLRLCFPGISHPLSPEKLQNIHGAFTNPTSLIYTAYTEPPVWVPVSRICILIECCQVPCVVYCETQDGPTGIVHPDSHDRVRALLQQTSKDPLADAVQALVQELRYNPDAGRVAREVIDARDGATHRPESNLPNPYRLQEEH